MRLKRILATNQDAGGANAIAPVLARLHQDSRLEIRVIGWKHSKAVFEREKISFETPESLGWKGPDDSREIARFIYSKIKPEVLLTGTSGPESLEKYLIEASKAEGALSLAVVDASSYYENRFGPPRRDGSFSFLPTLISAVDEECREGMIRIGIPAEKIIVGGQPYLETLMQRFSGRTQLDFAPGISAPWRLLFISESHSEDFGRSPDHPGYLGYTEESVLGDILQILSDLETTLGQKVEIFIKPHPKENPAKFETHLRKNPGRIRLLAPLESALENALRSDAVVGMSSIALYEAALLGVPVLSYQPGQIPGQLKEPYPFREAGITMLGAQAGLLSTLVKLLRDSRSHPCRDSRVLGERYRGSTERVVAGVYSLLEKKAAS